MASHTHLVLGHFARQHVQARGRRSRGNLKPVRPSRRNELWYTDQLLQITRLLRAAAMKDLLPALKDDPRFATDSFTPAQNTALDKMARDFGGIQKTADRLAALAVKRNLEAVDTQLVANVKKAIGVDLSGVMTRDGAIRAAVEEATKANVALITSIPATFFDKLRANLLDNLVEGARFEDLQDFIKHTCDVTDSRAKLIARDQTSKMNGNFNEARQTSIGIEKYTWQTAGDERVRETHAENDGKVFRWDDPPVETGHPGEDINCRCVAIPYFDLDEMEPTGDQLDDVDVGDDYNPDEPRDDHGMWSAGASAKEKEATASTPLSEEEQQIALARLDSLENLADKVGVNSIWKESKTDHVAAADVFHHPDVRGMYWTPQNKTQEKKGVLTRIDLRTVEPAQVQIPREGLRAYIKSLPKADPTDSTKSYVPEVVQYLGRNFVASGHTRLGAQILAGRTHATVRYYKLDKNGKLI